MKQAEQTSCTEEGVRDACAHLGFPGYSRETIHALTTYLSLLSKWNRVMNLVGRAGWRDILETLLVDSFHLADFVKQLPLPDHPVCQDLGAGAGLPGVPLRMLWQSGAYTLVEAREKRALFLRTVLAKLPLPGVSVFHGRAEAFMAGRPPVTLTISRAFLPWEKVLTLVDKHTAPGGYCLFLTLSPLPESLPEGWRGAGEKHYSVGKDSRCFWALRKTGT